MCDATSLIPIVPHFLVNMGDLNEKMKQLQLLCDVDVGELQYRPSNACNFEVLEVQLVCKDESAYEIFYDHQLEGTPKDKDANWLCREKEGI